MAAKRNSLWAQLQARLKAVTAQRGMKTALANKFKVSQAAVSQWLSRDNPTAETILRLDEWVTDQEKKQKGPGSAETPPERKTQRKESKHENQPSGRRRG